MSAFLGPIHFWVYNKIQIQNKIVEEIIDLSERSHEGLREELNAKYGLSETRPLDEVIDGGNIHGWLQEQVSLVEYKLAYSVTSLMKRDSDNYLEIERIFTSAGRDKALSTDLNSPTDVYKVLNDSLLDGMPCDHANKLIEESSERVLWKRQVCVHKSYWEEVGGDTTIYYLLRDAYIKGLLEDTSLVYEKLDGENSVIRRERNE